MSFLWYSKIFFSLKSILKQFLNESAHDKNIIKPKRQSAKTFSTGNDISNVDIHTYIIIYTFSWCIINSTSTEHLYKYKIRISTFPSSQRNSFKLCSVFTNRYLQLWYFCFDTHHMFNLKFSKIKLLDIWNCTVGR